MQHRILVRFYLLIRLLEFLLVVFTLDRLLTFELSALNLEENVGSNVFKLSHFVLHLD
jgi:hypothetical protein